MPVSWRDPKLNLSSTVQTACHSCPAASRSLCCQSFLSRAGSRAMCDLSSRLHRHAQGAQGDDNGFRSPDAVHSPRRCRTLPSSDRVRAATTVTWLLFSFSWPASLLYINTQTHRSARHHSSRGKGGGVVSQKGGGWDGGSGGDFTTSKKGRLPQPCVQP